MNEREREGQAEGCVPASSPSPSQTDGPLGPVLMVVGYRAPGFHVKARFLLLVLFNVSCHMSLAGHSPSTKPGWLPLPAPLSWPWWSRDVPSQLPWPCWGWEGGWKWELVEAALPQGLRASGLILAQVTSPSSGGLWAPQFPQWDEA